MPFTRSQAARTAAGSSDHDNNSVHSSRSSAETQIRAEAARREAELELDLEQAVARRVAAQKKAVEAQCEADIAALDEASSRSLTSSVRRTQVWLQSQQTCDDHTNVRNLSDDVIPAPVRGMDKPPGLSNTMMTIDRVWESSAAVTPIQMPAQAVDDLPTTTCKPSARATLTGVNTYPGEFVVRHVDVPPSSGPYAGGQVYRTTLTHNHSDLGTHPHNYVNRDNKDSTREHDSDIQKLAAAIQGLARPAPREERSRRVSDIRLPAFSGDSMEWLTFKKTFERTSPHFDPLENISRIVTALSGAAKEAVATLVAATDNPDLIMLELERLFGRPELIVRQLVADLNSLPRVRNDVTGLSSFAFKVRNAVYCMKLVNRTEYLMSPEFSDAVLSKLSPLMKSKFMDFAAASYRTGMSKLELISDFITRKVEINLAFGTQDSIRALAVNCHRQNAKVFFTAADEKDSDVDDANSMDMEQVGATSFSRSTNKLCPFCTSSDHRSLEECSKFLLLDALDRCRWAKQKQICMKCLKGNHVFKLCNARCDECSKPHHTLLHSSTPAPTPAPRHQISKVSVAKVEVENQNPAKIESESTKVTEESVAVAHNIDDYFMSRPLLKVIPLTVSGPSGSVDTFALLDDGSTTSLIDQGLANAVVAVGPKGSVNIKCIGGLQKSSEVTYVDIEVEGKRGDRCSIVNIKAIPNLDLSSQTVSRTMVAQLPYLSDLTNDLCYDSPAGKPMLIIGADNWHLTLPRAVRRGSRDQPVAVLTALGWVLYGKLGNVVSRCTVDEVNFVSDQSDSCINEMLKDYLNIDSIGITKKTYVPPSDARALQLLQNTTSRLPSGRFQTGLLWKPDVGTVPDNYKMALSRFYNLENKLKKDETLKLAYKANIDAMISKGYAEVCPPTIESPGVRWYLPHFGVRHPIKQKLRVVHDAAAKFRGVSLNSMLLSGPDLLQPLTGMLMQFRERRVALIADIREMFPQVKIVEADRDAQRFLWRDDPSLPVTCYRMSSMMFGATCSPCSAMYVKNINAVEHKEEYPHAAQAIIENHYMDDLVISLDDEQTAAQLAQDIIYVHSRACFEMRSWLSNSDIALSLVPTELQSDVKTTGVLGMCWNAQNDSLLFSRVSPKHTDVEKLTKRKILSQLMQVFDPLGLLTPLVLKGRLIFQQIWNQYDWDSKLPPSVTVKWLDWLKNLDLISQNSIPRCYLGPTHLEVHERQLHVFADASQHAYATVAYWRFLYSNSTVKLSLIGGKSRLAPPKPISIPRLELQAALIACRFAEFIKTHHKNVPDKIFFWTDSSTVLKWLRSDAATFKPFVAHRIGEICGTSEVNDWHYVPSSLNVADDATRFDPNFQINSRWFLGPSFLFGDTEDWPKESGEISPLARAELKNVSELVVQISTHPPKPPSPVVADHSRFSEWTRLLRATARAHVCARRFKAFLTKEQNYSRNPTNPPPNSIPALLAADIKLAELHLLRRSQLDAFYDKDCKWPSQLKRLKTFVDEDQLLRLSSRISSAPALPPTLDPSPVVLSGHHPIVELLVRAYHKKFAHANTETIVNELRERFFIIPLRPTVRRIASSCPICRIRRAQPVTPPFGNLPDARVAYFCRPFSFVGLDYFGPTLVSCGRRILKRYVALFTCLTVRAIHLEVVETLSSDSAIMALRRFIARRGCPVKIFSDNGTAFVGAARQLTEVFDFAANKKIEWVFIPPAAPFMGGAWERLVRSVKTALSTTLKQRAPREEVLGTLLAEAEAIVNSRPLTHVAVESDSEVALTPFHFLLNSSPDTPVSKTMEEVDLSRRCEWRKGLRLADHFWQRWTKEALPLLAPRRDGCPTNLLEGDLVVIMDGALPRGSWPMGRITKVWPGPDGITRVAEVQTKGGKLKRAVKLLVPLHK